MKTSLWMVAGILCVGLPSWAGTINVSTSDTAGSLVVGSDPFFWANALLQASGSATNPVASSCGANCASYSLTSLVLAVAGTNIFPVVDPALKITYNASGSSLYELSGLITVATYTTQFDLALGLPQGTIDANSLTNMPTFPITFGKNSFCAEVASEISCRMSGIERKAM